MGSAIPCLLDSAAKLKGLLPRGAIVECAQIKPVHQEAELNFLTVDTELEAVPIDVQILLEGFDTPFHGPFHRAVTVTIGCRS
jgi:hypothetical protein